MLEVVFNDSAKGAMIIAKKHGNEDVVREPIVHTGDEESQQQFEGESIGGNAEDVVCIGFNLDVGDIAHEIDGDERKRTFVKLFGSIDFEQEEIEEFFNYQRDDLEKLVSAAKNGTPIRIWKSNTPFSTCGYAYLCDVLRAIDCKISVVSFPQYTPTQENKVPVYVDWSSLHPSEFHRFLYLEREISLEEKWTQSDLWQKLKRENAALRALGKGQLVSVPEDFYDPIIIENIPEGEFVMARLMGNILSKYPLGVSDGWYALRIKKMIDDNHLKVVGNRDTSHPYGKILRKTSPCFND